MKPYPSPEEFCYPVKRRGERRRLNPNQAGIDWLEEESETETEISLTYPMGEIVDLLTSDERREFLVQRALGHSSARQRGMYPWPMFEVHTGFKASMLEYPKPCPDCDNWARTSRCTSHHDRDGVAGLAMGEERRRERRRERSWRARQTVAAVPPASVHERVLGRDFFTRAAAEGRATVPGRPACPCEMCTAVRSFTRPHSATVEMNVEGGVTVRIDVDIERLD